MRSADLLVAFLLHKAIRADCAVLPIINQQVTIDSVQMTIENDKISVEGLSVGTHQLIWQIQDECGAAFTGILEINM